MGGVGANTLCKAERLCGKTSIEALVKKGRYGSVHSLRFCYLQNSLNYSRIIISVPKKYFKRAVMRNLLKRRIREAYRQNKLNIGYDILFIYATKEVMPYATIKSWVVQVLQEVQNEAAKC